MRSIKNSKIILFFVVFVCATNVVNAVSAQSYEPTENMQSYATQRTISGTRNEKSQCYDDDMIVGKRIGFASHIIDQQDEKYGGTMLHEKANNIRAALFNETYGVRNKIQQLVYYGDVEKCHSARDTALKIIDSIMREGK